MPSSNCCAHLRKNGVGEVVHRCVVERKQRCQTLCGKCVGKCDLCVRESITQTLSIKTPPDACWILLRTCAMVSNGSVLRISPTRSAMCGATMDVPVQIPYWLPLLAAYIDCVTCAVGEN